MKKDTKGFTLIELLAVIVILAVIALIATPIILNLIERARQGAAESSAYAYIEAAEKAAVVKMMNEPNIKINGDCTASEEDGKAKLACDGAVELELDVKGDIATGGTVTFDTTTGSITDAEGLVIGNYTVTYANDKATATAKS